MPKIRRRIRRWFARWWHRNICAPAPRPAPRLHHGLSSAWYAESASPHPMQHPVVWIGADDPDEAWSVMAGGVV